MKQHLSALRLPAKRVEFRQRDVNWNSIVTNSRVVCWKSHEEQLYTSSNARVTRDLFNLVKKAADTQN